ncbi:MAG TPA: DNA translocase FtsK 4TM domain-containing protein, partial [Kofleriaceae bacterium]|nr:DNA translocase FtsK 4TM domain-containing protein [Kofleriaceae bacterium]
MKRNQAVKPSSRIRNAGAAARAARSGRRNQRSRTPEIIGVASLGIAIFLGAGLLSLQLGDGRLMGPFGRSCAALVYSLFGIGGYAVAAGAGIIAVRLLVGRQPVARPSVVLGVALGLAAFNVLVHLCAARYRVAGYPPGGALGEGIGEVLRALVSTAGTALLALVGLVVAVVVATPLRMGQVLEATWQSARWTGRGTRRVATDVAGFTGEVIRAILPERDRDEYADDEGDEEHVVDESMVEMEAAACEPPIIDRSGRLVEMPAGDTERMTGDEVPALVAEDGTTVARKKRRRKKTDLGVGETMPPKTAVMDAQPEPPPPAPAASGDGPVIVESQFRHPKKDEMKAKEEKVDAS